MPCSRGDLPIFEWSGQSAATVADLTKMDSLIFEIGFNRCELDQLRPHISKDLRFYHDSGGASFGADTFFEISKRNICSNPERKPIRKLVEGSLEVFPLYSEGKLYGAVQNGTHAFFIREPGKELYQTSIAKFTHLWLLQDGRWVLESVLSFDHQDPK